MKALIDSCASGMQTRRGHHVGGVGVGVILVHGDLLVERPSCRCLWRRRSRAWRDGASSARLVEFRRRDDEVDQSPHRRSARRSRRRSSPSRVRASGRSTARPRPWASCRTGRPSAGRAERRLLARHGEVGGGDQLATAAGGERVDPSDDRLGDRLDGLHHRRADAKEVLDRAEVLSAISAKSCPAQNSRPLAARMTPVASLSPTSRERLRELVMSASERTFNRSGRFSQMVTVSRLRSFSMRMNSMAADTPRPFTSTTPSLIRWKTVRTNGTTVVVATRY